MTAKDENHGGDCTCRRCTSKATLDEMAERVDAYKTAQSLLKDVPTVEDVQHHPSDYLILATWLFYGETGSD